MNGMILGGLTLRIGLLVTVLALAKLSAQGFNGADADLAMEAYTRAFYVAGDGKGHFRNTTEGGTASFWMQAEELELVLDAYERTTNASHLALFTNLFNGFVSRHGLDWQHNEYNDDIMWMVIASVRGYLHTSNLTFRAAAQRNFDACFARAWSDDLGGGLWWRTNNTSKNACVNCPGAIAAFLLGRAIGDDSYLVKATNLFRWERTTLFDASTGRVSDNIQRNGRRSPRAFTYNQGTFIGAANFLGFTNEAALAANYTMNRMGRDGLLPQSGETGDGGGFNGIAARWIARFMKDRRLEGTYLNWLQKNADAAWNVRRPSDNLSWCRWPEPTPEGLRYSWGCSSAVVILQVVPPNSE